MENVISTALVAAGARLAEARDELRRVESAYPLWELADALVLLDEAIGLVSHATESAVAGGAEWVVDVDPGLPASALGRIGLILLEHPGDDRLVLKVGERRVIARVGLSPALRDAVHRELA